MKLRTSRILAIGALLIAVNLPMVASAASRDGGIDRDGRFNRIIRIVKKILKVTPQDEVPSIPKP